MFSSARDREGQDSARSNKPRNASRVVFGCATDSNGRFVEQAARLLLSLRWFGGELSKSPFFLALVGQLTEAQRDFFERHDAQIFSVERFDETHGPSNKLRFFDIPALDRYDTIVLLDCDTLIVQDPTDWLECPGFAAKPADLPTVSDQSLCGMLSAFNLPIPERSYRHDVADQPCLPYFNSGVIVLRSEWRTRFIEAWSHYDRELIADPEPFGVTPFHVDQASLTCALIDVGIPIKALPSCMNFPVHLKIERYAQNMFEVDPVIIHYHWLSDHNGYIAPLMLPQANLRANSFNARLRAERGGSEVTRTKWPSRNKGKVVVATGWWSDGSESEWNIGANVTRSTTFFDTWYRQVMKCIDPNRIVVTDSASPIKPDWSTYPRVQWVELDKNYGHPNDLRTGRISARFSGYTRSVINGAMFAYCCDADYFVYVEQDCLVRGPEFLKSAIGDDEHDILLGARTEGGRGLGGGRAAPMLQNSLIIVSRNGLERFISGIINSPEGDGECSIEIIMERHCSPFGVVKIPYGRSRPIDFETPCFYAQHFTEDELEEFFSAECGRSYGELVARNLFDV